MPDLCLRGRVQQEGLDGSKVAACWAVVVGFAGADLVGRLPVVCASSVWVSTSCYWHGVWSSVSASRFHGCRHAGHVGRWVCALRFGTQLKWKAWWQRGHENTSSDSRGVTFWIPPSARSGLVRSMWSAGLLAMSAAGAAGSRESPLSTAKIHVHLTVVVFLCFCCFSLVWPR